MFGGYKCFHWYKDFLCVQMFWWVGQIFAGGRKGMTLSIQLPPGRQGDNISLLSISLHKEPQHLLTIIDGKLKFSVQSWKMCNFWSELKKIMF